MALFLYFLHYWFSWKSKLASPYSLPPFFPHFHFNSISITLKLFLLKPSSHLQSPNLVALLQFPTYLALMLLSLHHSFLQFFPLWLPSYPCPKRWLFWQFLSHLFHTFSHCSPLEYWKHEGLYFQSSHLVIPCFSWR